MMSDSPDERRGLIFNIQKFSINCPWCSNPEGMSSEPEIMVGERKCISCKRCAEACGAGAISFDNDIRTIDWKLCTNCLECGRVCPSHAIQVMGEYKTVDEAFKIAAQDRDFYNTSGGGVTISGGEPLLQWEFVRDGTSSRNAEMLVFILRLIRRPTARGRVWNRFSSTQT